MSRGKILSLLRKVLYPKAPLLFLLSLAVFPALIYVFATEREDGAVAYVLYALSAYCLTALVLFFLRVFRRAKKMLPSRIRRTALGERMLDDPAFRAVLGLSLGSAVNLLAAGLRFAVGGIYGSVWFLSIAVYELCLGILRLLLLVGWRRRTPESEERLYRRTARLLFLLNIPMGGMILLTVVSDAGYTYPGYVIYVSAMYTFYTVTVAVVNLFRYRKFGSPVLSAAKVLSFVSALMSLLGLQTAMIAGFSGGNEPFRRTMNAVTGGCVWGAVIVTAVLMLTRKKQKRGEFSDAENPCGK